MLYSIFLPDGIKYKRSNTVPRIIFYKYELYSFYDLEYSPLPSNSDFFEVNKHFVGKQISCVM
jgi:hypothetical protein